MVPGHSFFLTQCHPRSIADIYFWPDSQYIDIRIGELFLDIYPCLQCDLTFPQHQHTEYQEVTVKGDLSESDISNTAALASAFNVNSSFRLYFL